jgi:cytoskeletal protein CcmA (bactofilin family)
MMGGTGNVTAGAVNGYELKTTTTNSTIYGSSLKINPIVNSALNTTMDSVSLTPYGMEIVPAVISITGSIIESALKVRGSAHSNTAAVIIDKEDIPGVLPSSAISDSNKILTVSYTTSPVVDILASGKLWMNGATGAVLAVKATTDSGYLAKFEQGDYSGSNLEGLFVAISTATVARNIAVFNAGATGSIVSAMRIDGAGNMFLRNNLSVGNNLSISGNSVFSGILSVGGNARIEGNLSVVGNTNITGSLSVLGNATITNNLSYSTGFVGNLSISSNVSIGGNADITGNVVIGNLSITTRLSVANFNGTSITAQNITGQTGAFGNLTVTGSTTFGSLAYTDLSVAGNLSVGGTVVSSMNLAAGLSVAGNIITNNNLSVAGTIRGSNYPARVFYGKVSRGVATVTVTTFTNTISDTLATSATSPFGLYVSSITFTGTTTYGSFSLSSSNTIVQTQTIESTSAGSRCQNVSFSGTPNTIDITNVVGSTNGTGAWDYFLTVLYFG